MTAVDDSAQRKAQIELVANSPDETWFRVKDKDTKHEYSIGKSAYDVNAHEILLDSDGDPRPGRGLDGTVLPAKPFVDLKSLPSKNTPDSTNGDPDGSQEPNGPGSEAAGTEGAAPSGQKAEIKKETTR